MTADPAVDLPRDKPVVLFDGVCNLCSGAVQFLLEHDEERRLRFAALQSAAGRALLAEFDRPHDDLDTFVLVDGRECYDRSTAALRIARLLGFPWSLLSVLLAVPRPVRDAAYDLVARTRYDVFGRKESCTIPTPDVRARFVGDPTLVPDEAGQ